MASSYPDTADRPRFARNAIVLGLVAIASPLALNMYVPAFPAMAEALHTSTASIQLSVVSYLAAVAIGQLIYGPLSDRFGRRLPLFVGLGLFVAASIGASLAPSVEALVAWRLVQGFGACAAMAIPRAVVRDLHTGRDAARLLSSMLLIVSVSPLLAPFFGSAIIAVLPWNAIFWFVGGAGAIAFLLVLFLLPETHPAAARTGGGLGPALAGYARLLRDGEYLWMVMTISFAQGAYFAYLGGSPFVFLSVYGLEPWQYSLIFALGALAWAASMQVSPWLMHRIGGRRLTTLALLFANAVSIALTAAGASGLVGLWLLVIAITLMFAAIGIIGTPLTVMALHHHGSVAGTASALMGTLNFAMGAVASSLVSLVSDGTELPMLAVMAGATIAAQIASWLAFRRSAQD